MARMIVGGNSFVNRWFETPSDIEVENNYPNTQSVTISQSPSSGIIALNESAKLSPGLTF